jgi:hypothetical protein
MPQGDEPDDDVFVNDALSIDPLPALAARNTNYYGAVCVTVDPDAWYPQVGEPGTQARSICRTCPAQVECLQDAVEMNEIYGIWGGLSPRPRRAVRSLIRDGHIDADYIAIAAAYNDNHRDPYWYRILLPVTAGVVRMLEDFICPQGCLDQDDCTCDGAEVF